MINCISVPNCRVQFFRRQSVNFAEILKITDNESKHDYSFHIRTAKDHRAVEKP